MVFVVFFLYMVFCEMQSYYIIMVLLCEELSLYGVWVRRRYLLYHINYLGITQSICNKIIVKKKHL